nr:hypothetical protein L203_03784 [Cryptococcus depauperatus CBS 7841]
MAQPDTDYYNQMAHYTSAISDYVQVEFSGSSLHVFGSWEPAQGNFMVSIDRVSSNHLNDGPHTLILTNLGEGPKGNYIKFDYVVGSSTIDPTYTELSNHISTDLTSTSSVAPVTGDAGLLAIFKSQM